MHGSVVKAILTTAYGEKADLVVVASHGRTELSRVFCGSMVAGVLYHLERPLLVVRSVGSK